MSWTDERVALLKKLWGEGKTAAEIAQTLGGVTRNAVIGKAHRLKLSNRLSPIQQNNKKPAPKPVEDKPMPRKVANDTAIMDQNIKGVQLSELKEKMCRWPIGDPKDADFRFCGCQAIAGLPYCGEHAKVAYQAATRNRILQAEDFEEKETEDDAKEAAAG
ncbi:MAG: gcrA cell cycle regulator family protein [Rhodospirillales bacterium]|nr:gcrA cell cycle regulator family protein [Rhodospirillales bacterium]MCB9997301.1 gcrA cell cycle regulator family protein [Rhodospirillales bacterium]